MPSTAVQMAQRLPAIEFCTWRFCSAENVQLAAGQLMEVTASTAWNPAPTATRLLSWLTSVTRRVFAPETGLGVPGATFPASGLAAEADRRP